MLVLVGALNVGKMLVTFEESVQTNGDATTPQHYSYENLKLNKAELFGWFEMGSTILTFSQKGAITPQLSIAQKVRFGETVATLTTLKES